MKKSLIIILSLCALFAIGTLIIPNVNMDKTETIPKQTQTLVKTIQQEKGNHKKAMETFNRQKVSLQKQLVQSKLDLQNSQLKTASISKQVKQLKDKVQQVPVEDTTQTIDNCLILTGTIDSLLYSNQRQDSLFCVQTTMYDSLICIQQNEVNTLGKSNQNYAVQLDTLLALNTALQKQIKKDYRKLVFTKIGNRALASGLLISTSIAKYLQLKNRI
jgi:uncharacterized protein YxeA